MSLFIKTAEGYRPLWISRAPCPNSNKLEGVYRPEPVEQAQKKLASRLERFLHANGINNMVEKQQYFRGDHFIEPMFGAFGEKL